MQFTVCRSIRIRLRPLRSRKGMEPKERDIADMFDAISGRYDLLNHVLSGYTDVRWRKKTVRLSMGPGVKDLLDVSSGTGDMAIAYHKARPDLRIYGLDVSRDMLERAKGKAPYMRLVQGSGLSLPFRDSAFDLVSCAFGIRNIYPREQGLREFFRVLRPGGAAAILEFSMPRGVFGNLYKLYFEKALPRIGNLLSSTHAYSYLMSSVEAFPEPALFTRMLAAAGFKDIAATVLTGGVAVIYSARK